MGALKLSEEAGYDRTRVLVVEDEVLVRMLIAETLRQDGCEVLEAASGDEALALLGAEESPDVIVTDIRMPGRTNGLQLAAQARSLRPGVKVLVASAFPPTDGGRGVADAFLAKPFGLAEVAQRVRDLAQRP
jgi:CheY-like chemotaxis protein